MRGSVRHSSSLQKTYTFQISRGLTCLVMISRRILCFFFGSKESVKNLKKHLRRTLNFRSKSVQSFSYSFLVIGRINRATDPGIFVHHKC